MDTPFLKNKFRGPLIGQSETSVEMSVGALIKTAQYIMEHKADFNIGDTFTLTGIDGKKIKMLLKQ